MNPQQTLISQIITLMFKVKKKVSVELLCKVRDGTAVI